MAGDSLDYSVHSIKLEAAGTRSPTIKGIEKGVRYTCFLFNPTNGERIEAGEAEPDSNGDWRIQGGAVPKDNFPICQDWVVLCTKKGQRPPL